MGQKLRIVSCLTCGVGGLVCDSLWTLNSPYINPYMNCNRDRVWGPVIAREKVTIKLGMKIKSKSKSKARLSPSVSFPTQTMFLSLSVCVCVLGPAESASFSHTPYTHRLQYVPPLQGPLHATKPGVKGKGEQGWAT
jgi:hypothetical protein